MRGRAMDGRVLRRLTRILVLLNRSMESCVWTAMLGLMLALQAGAQEARIITFDAPGADTKPGDYNGTYPGCINAWGAVTGSYQDANSTYHGFLRKPNGEFITFDAPGADSSPFNGTSPTSINDLGAIAGSYVDASGISHGFLRSREGKFTKFDGPGAGGYGSFPLAINLEGCLLYTSPS